LLENEAGRIDYRVAGQPDEFSGNAFGRWWAKGISLPVGRFWASPELHEGSKGGGQKTRRKTQKFIPSNQLYGISPIGRKTVGFCLPAAAFGAFGLIGWATMLYTCQVRTMRVFVCPDAKGFGQKARKFKLHPFMAIPNLSIWLSSFAA
jgi:hypothetical protein